MNDIAIRVENLGKKYRRGLPAGHDRLSEMAVNLARGVWNLASGGRRAGAEPARPSGEFWAVKDVSFDVKRGDVVGIIGRNGAGKSTLLKLLSRITEPTSGRFGLRGRVASLLEVGTGFHGELTGRENLFLSGTLLGMGRREIQKKFDEIVAFAELDAFLDTPVKRYSSGMYTRLAFAVAAHLEPEILIVDEVLAVGDAAFQRKCLGKMDEVAKQGRTILYVSHNLESVRSLCTRAVHLRNGSVVADGAASTIVARYQDEGAADGAIPLAERADRAGDGRLKFTRWEMRDADGNSQQTLATGSDAVIVFHYVTNSQTPLRDVHFALGIDNASGRRIVWLGTNMESGDFESLHENENCVELHIPRLPLLPGRYGFTLFSTIGTTIADWVKNAGWFDVEIGDYYGNGRLPPKGNGDVIIPYTFRRVGAESPSQGEMTPEFAE